MDDQDRAETNTGAENRREVSVMEFEGDFVVDGTPEEVWPYFNDPDILQDCAPGCEALVLESPSRLRATLSVSVGSVKPTFDVQAVVVESDEPNRLELRASGEASRNSFEVTAWQELTDNGDETTTVTWGADAQVSGIIASLGERALESVTRKLVNDFFTDIEAHITAGTPAEAKFEAAEEVEEVAAERLTPAVGGPAVGGPVDIEGDNVGRYVFAGAAIGALATLLWFRLRRRGDEDASSGGRLRYLLVGVAIGAVGKLLWDEYTGDDVIDRTTPDVGEEDDVSPADVEAAELADATAEKEAEAADAEREAKATETEREADEETETVEAGETDAVDAGHEADEGGDEEDADEQEGMIDDPLDRLR